MHESPRAIGHYAVLATLIILGSLLAGCASRSVRSPVINRVGIQVDLVREVKGWTTQPRGFQHPTIISVQRLIHILNAVEVETRGKGEGFIREPAFHPDIVERTAQAVSEALAEADVDEEIAVQIVRKEMRFGVLHRKSLTSFLAYIDEDHLYLIMRRVHWPIPDTAGSQKNEGLPKPRRDYSPMKFRVVAGEHLYYAGPQTLEIDWRNPVFQTAFRLPGSTKGERRRREVIDRSPIPQAEKDAAAGLGNTISLDELSPDQLRALADLEDDRRQGRVTESAYQRARRQLLRQR